MSGITIRHPRSTVNFKAEIWENPEWLELDSLAQWLYIAITTSPSISQVGVHEYRPGRLAALATDTNADDISLAATELAQAGWVTLDADTDEIAITGYLTRNIWFKTPATGVSATNATKRIISREIRNTVLQELRHLADTQPNNTAFSSPQIQKLLRQ